MKYETMKVFNCQDMPDDVRKSFFEQSENKGNDCYISIWIEPEEDDMKLDSVQQWLLDNGASLGELVIVQHWW